MLCESLILAGLAGLPIIVGSWYNSTHSLMRSLHEYHHSETKFETSKIAPHVGVRRSEPPLKSEEKSRPELNPVLPGGRLRPRTVCEQNRSIRAHNYSTSKMSDITTYSIKTDLEKYNFG